MKTRQVINILIASPGDVADERAAIAPIFARWNNSNHQAVLVPVAWESSATPSLGAHPQEIINDQLIHDSDLLVAIFHSRLGTPTPTARSGTDSEIKEFIAQKGPGRVMVYFSTRGFPHDVDPQELIRLRAFKDEMRSQGLYYEFNSVTDFERDLYWHLDHKIAELLDGKLPLPVHDQPNDNTKLDETNPDPRLRRWIDYGNTLEEIARGFATQMSRFDAIDGAQGEKYYKFGSHVYDSVAINLEKFLAHSADYIALEDRAFLQRISTELKILAADIPPPGAPFPKYWDEGETSPKHCPPTLDS